MTCWCVGDGVFTREPRKLSALENSELAPVLLLPMPALTPANGGCADSVEEESPNAESASGLAQKSPPDGKACWNWTRLAICWAGAVCCICTALLVSLLRGLEALCWDGREGSPSTKRSPASPLNWLSNSNNSVKIVSKSSSSAMANDCHRILRILNIFASYSSTIDEPLAWAMLKRTTSNCGFGGTAGRCLTITCWTEEEVWAQSVTVWTGNEGAASSAAAAVADCCCWWRQTAGRAESPSSMEGGARPMLGLGVDIWTDKVVKRRKVRQREFFGGTSKCCAAIIWANLSKIPITP